MTDENVRYLLDRVQEAIWNMRNHKDYDISKPNTRLYSEKEKYIMAYFDYYNKLNEAKFELKKVEIFLRRFPERNYYETNEIDELTYIKYHLEVYYHKINTILDLKKLLVNQVFEIGLATRTLSWERLKKNELVKNNAISFVLDEYYDAFKSVINARNINTHKGDYPDSTHDEINSSFLVYKLSKQAEIDVSEEFKKLMPEFIVKYQMKKHRKDKIKFVKDANEVAEAFIDIFIKISLQEFRKRCELKS